MISFQLKIHAVLFVCLFVLCCVWCSQSTAKGHGPEGRDRTASDPARTQPSHRSLEIGLFGATGSRKTYICSLFAIYLQVVYGTFYPRSCFLECRHDFRNHTHTWGDIKEERDIKAGCFLYDCFQKQIFVGYGLSAFC